MAGEGSRFAKEGYTFPKPLIDVNGKPMIQAVVENLDFNANHIFLVRKEHLEKYEGLADTLQRITNGKCVIVEVDVRSKCGGLYLGHDEPKYKVRQNLLRFNRIICHAKDKEALRIMLEDGEIHCFWHENDDYTMTSKGWVWVFPSKELIPNSVCVLPEYYKRDDFRSLNKCRAVCSDYVGELSECSSLEEWVAVNA